MCVFKKNPSNGLKGEGWLAHSWRQKTRRLFYKLVRDNEVVHGERTDLRNIPKFENENCVWVLLLPDISAEHQKAALVKAHTQALEERVGR